MGDVEIVHCYSPNMVLVILCGKVGNVKNFAVKYSRGSYSILYVMFFLKSGSVF